MAYFEGSRGAEYKVRDVLGYVRHYEGSKGEERKELEERELRICRVIELSTHACECVRVARRACLMLVEACFVGADVGDQPLIHAAPLLTLVARRAELRCLRLRGALSRRELVRR